MKIIIIIIIHGWKKRKFIRPYFILSSFFFFVPFFLYPFNLCLRLCVLADVDLKAWIRHYPPNEWMKMMLNFFVFGKQNTHTDILCVCMCVWVHGMLMMIIMIKKGLNEWILNWWLVCRWWWKWKKANKIETKKLKRKNFMFQKTI